MAPNPSAKIPNPNPHPHLGRQAGEIRHRGPVARARRGEGVHLHQLDAGAGFRVVWRNPDRLDGTLRAGAADMHEVEGYAAAARGNRGLGRIDRWKYVDAVGLGQEESPLRCRCRSL